MQRWHTKLIKCILTNTTMWYIIVSKSSFLLEKESLTNEEAEQPANAARALLVHVSNCDGLAILLERLKPEELD